MTGRRPGPPYAAPRGQRWVPDYAENADPVEAIPVVPGHGDRKCRQRRGNPYNTNPCNATSVARVGDPDGWICENHLHRKGMWVDAGIVMRWVLESTADEEE